MLFSLKQYVTCVLEKLCLHSYTCVVMYFLKDDIKWYEHMWEHSWWSSESTARGRLVFEEGERVVCPWVAITSTAPHQSWGSSPLWEINCVDGLSFWETASLKQTPFTISKLPDFKKYHHVPKQGSHFSFMDLYFNMAVQQSRLQCNKTTRFLHF